MIKKLIIAGFIIFLGCLSAHAQMICPLPGTAKPKGVASLKSFKGLPILDQGRIKPLDTYARNLLLQFSGRRSYNREEAVRWLSKLLFAPEQTRKDTVFLINNPDIPATLGIEPVKNRRYSFEQLNPALEKLGQLARMAQQIDEKERDIVDNEILRVYTNVLRYAEISYALGFIFPHPDFQIGEEAIVTYLQLPPEQGVYSFLDLAVRAQLLQQRLDQIGITLQEKWSEEDEKYLNLVKTLRYWSIHNQSSPFAVLPDLNPQEEGWISPWESINQDFHDGTIKTELSLWQQLYISYWTGQQLQFDLAVKNLKHSVTQRVNEQEQKKIRGLGLELMYNKLNLFFWAKLVFAFSLLLYTFSWIKAFGFSRKMALGLNGIALLATMAAILMRMAILSRPPVSNLYETFIFVAFICVLTGIIIECINKRWIGNVVASVGGFCFLMIAGKYSAEGDTLQMLVAVLNSNFWLSTHVISITVGYAGCCVAGIIGHIYLLQRLLKPKNKELLEGTYQNLVVMMVFGLTMTFLGTVLGGIWADQSWGRFWGWDPKENGALLIVIWCAIVFHARISGWIQSVGFAAGAALGIIVVMWAWFGVNLLGIGLHSYGFTSGIARNLVIYIVLELLFVGFVTFRIKKS